jgi:hypothetical protein
MVAESKPANGPYAASVNVSMASLPDDPIAANRRSTRHVTASSAAEPGEQL